MHTPGEFVYNSNNFIVSAEGGFTGFQGWAREKLKEGFESVVLTHTSEDDLPVVLPKLDDLQQDSLLLSAPGRRL